MEMGHLRAFLVSLLVQVCLLLTIAASVKVQGRPVNPELRPGCCLTPVCCFNHPECCQGAIP
uniref:Uncharacterized protein n=1 Tax=Triticum urartu TaxID=4572 RepID=A0A8R7UG84_TRIUA